VIAPLHIRLRCHPSSKSTGLMCLPYVLSAASNSDIEKKQLRTNSGKLQYQFRNRWRKLSGPPTALGLDGFVRVLRSAGLHDSPRQLQLMG
jgi:hypothetical protein